MHPCQFESFLSGEIFYRSCVDKVGPGANNPTQSVPSARETFRKYLQRRGMGSLLKFMECAQLIDETWQSQIFEATRAGVSQSESLVHKFMFQIVKPIVDRHVREQAAHPLPSSLEPLKIAVQDSFLQYAESKMVVSAKMCMQEISGLRFVVALQVITGCVN